MNSARVLLRTAGQFVRTYYPLLVLAVVWEAAVHLGWLNRVLFPAPSTILRSLWWLAQGPASPDGIGYRLQIHTALSLYRLMVGTALAMVVGISLGALMGISRLAYHIIRPLVSLLAPVPALAWTPVLMLLFGLGNRTTITVCFLAAVIPVIFNVNAGMQAITQKQIWAAQAMGASPWGIFIRVLLPGAMVYILSGVRLAIARAWRGLIASEMLAATTWGLGFQIVQAGEFMQMDVLYGSLFIIGLCGLALNVGAFQLVERRTVERWGLVVRR